MPRNTVLSIVKGIAIILMVVGHAEAPELVTNFIYTFHMPVFFIAAGYFFSRKNVDDPWGFCAKRFKGLYIPFLKWSIMFLVLHNIFFYFGILNEQYGNWTGGVTHPYTWHTAMSRLVMIFTSMSGYDEFMAGAFWFFRGLLVASILFLVLYKLLERSAGKPSAQTVTILICVIALAFTAFRIANGLKISTIPNGGMREVWGLFFFGVGVLFRVYEGRLPKLRWVAVGCFAGLCVAAVLHLSGMNNRGKMIDVLTLPLTGAAGFVLLYYVASVIDRRADRLKRLLVYIGDNTMAIFVFHIISFKVVSLIKIWVYGLDFGQIGCHMVIHCHRDDFFWVLYSIVGVALPLMWLVAYRKIKAKIPPVSLCKLVGFHRNSKDESNMN